MLRGALCLFALCLPTLVSLVASKPLHGYVLTPCKDSLSALSVAAVSRTGHVVAQAPVRMRGNFTLHGLLENDGYYTLHMHGAVRQTYAPLLIHVKASKLSAAYPRPNPLTHPVESNPPKYPRSVFFRPGRTAVYVVKRAPFRLSSLWSYKYRVFQAIAVIFVVWFPRVIRDLPKEMREELTGEKEPDIGDPNKVLKALLGRQPDEATQSDTQSQSSR